MSEPAAPAQPIALSVVVPCFNAEATLAVQLAALAEQSWDGGAWELIVADNGSTDGSRQVVDAWADRVPALRWVDASERGGPAHARNAGAAAARGEFLLFCDADDEVAPGWLAAMADALSTGSAELVASRYDAERLNPPEVRALHGTPQSDGLNVYDYPAYLPHAGGGGLGVVRTRHDEVGGFDEAMPALEDTDYCWRLQHAGARMAFVPAAVVHIRYRPSLAGAFRQARVYGEHNVRIYKRYRPLGMPKLGPLPGLVRWAKLLLTMPKLLASGRRGPWIWQAGWRFGRLYGCLKYRVLAL